MSITLEKAPIQCTPTTFLVLDEVVINNVVKAASIYIERFKTQQANIAYRILTGDGAYILSKKDGWRIRPPFSQRTLEWELEHSCRTLQEAQARAETVAKIIWERATKNP